jgi:hypothetical protein
MHLTDLKGVQCAQKERHQPSGPFFHRLDSPIIQYQRTDTISRVTCVPCNKNKGGAVEGGGIMTKKASRRSEA